MHEKHSVECAYHCFLYYPVDLSLAYSLGTVTSAEWSQDSSWSLDIFLEVPTQSQGQRSVEELINPRVAAEIASETGALGVYIKMLHDDGQWEQRLFL